MHELSICRGILSTVLDYRQRHNQLGSIESIQLAVGRLTHIDIASLRFNFRVIARQTPAEQAILEIQHIDAKARCQNCQAIFALQQYYEFCPSCQHYHKTILQGEEMTITSMEVQ